MRNPVICDSMDGLCGIMLNEVRHTEKDKYCIILNICGFLKKINSEKE